MIVLVAAGAIVPKLQVSSEPPAWGFVPVQSAAFAPPTVHDSPVGSVSVSVTAVELPVPPAVTVML